MNNMPKKIEPTKIEPTKIEAPDIESTSIEPTKIEPTNIEPTKIDPTTIEPTKIEPTNIEPTKIEPTNIEPTKIEPTKIEPTDVTGSRRARKFKDPSKYSKVAAISFFAIAAFGALATLLVGLNTGIDFNLFLCLISTLGALLLFFLELKKMNITQADLDAWNEQILAKHPNFNKDNLMKLSDLNKALNRFSYWTHTFKFGFAKVLACIALPAIVLTAGAGVVLPATGGGVGSDITKGTYLVDTSDGPGYKMVSTTAYKFNKDGTFQDGRYDYETKKVTWIGNGTYTKSGSSVSFKGGTCTIKNGGKVLDCGSATLRRQ